MKDDTISRAAAIDALAEWHDDAITNRLNNLPSAQPWIPCKTALPKKTGEYLVTIKWDENDYEVDCYEYNANRQEWNDGELFGGTVVAWTNKPAPWKGDQNG